MNIKFSSLMEKTLEQIDDISKRLSRPVKDLDDVRTAMAALKEIRENEIQIDMSLGPIEVQKGHFVEIVLIHVLIGVIQCAKQVSNSNSTRRSRKSRHSSIFMAEITDISCK